MLQFAHRRVASILRHWSQGRSHPFVHLALRIATHLDQLQWYAKKERNAHTHAAHDMSWVVVVVAIEF